MKENVSYLPSKLDKLKPQKSDRMLLNLNLCD